MMFYWRMDSVPIVGKSITLVNVVLGIPYMYPVRVVEVVGMPLALRYTLMVTDLPASIL